MTYASDTVSSSESASVFQALAYVDWKLSKAASEGFLISSSILSNNYSTSQNLDDYSLSLGLEYRASISNWKLSYQLNGKQSAFAGDDYLPVSEFSIDAKNQWSKETEIRIGFRQEEISSLSSLFNYLEGDRGRLSMRLKRRSGPRDFRYEYEHEINDRLESVTASYSPTRDQFAIQYFRHFSRKLRTGARMELRVSDYEPVGTQDREDERIRLKLDYRYQANDTRAINADIHYTDNQSTDPDYDYDKYTVMAGVTALF